ncbi:uncharacterized protein BXZ73DRAFT_72945 [Epithele typhae]|uniref:uncharacterized protein n=1 Tax=Epithele typhae TaxID=378194 RepID=UPI002008A0BF|nr:uncharacterized protein BXZ73DRAFT_72945 [Epithele typhae]KAH9946102.1 hypothetical protein BXZ73DRAFT_72945 [Epithele typhae]
MASPPPLSPRMTPTPAVLADYLSGYRHTDFPDLSSRRFAPNALHSVSLPIEHGSDLELSSLYPIIVAALGRVLGAYCGCQDILLALAVDEHEHVLPVRISWTENQTWKDVVSNVKHALEGLPSPLVHPDVLRHALELSPKQLPAAALVSVVQAVPVASDRLDEACGLQPNSQLARVPELSADLLSSWERQDDTKAGETYCFLPQTRLVYDHLSMRAAENPDGIAVHWFADLSTDVPISSYTPDTITYINLERRSNQFGRWLIQRGLARGRAVAICKLRDIWFHVALLEATRSLAHFSAAAVFDRPVRENYLSIASVAFDVHLSEIFCAFAVSLPIVSAPRSLLLEDLPYYIKHLRISHVGIVPSLIEATMGQVQEAKEAGQEMALRYIASGGEKMSDAILDQWASHPTVRLANFYGPSEVTIGCAARFMDKDTPRANIGHTFSTLHPTLWMKTSTSSSAKVFLRFPNDGSERWAYRTGDLVRMMPDQTLEIIGRIDTQIKLRGVRIESEGISSIIRNAAAPARTLDVLTVLAKHPDIGVDQLVSFIAWDQAIPIALNPGTNLFECGMHSLAVAGLSGEVRKTFGVKISPARIMQSPVIGDIATLIDGESSKTSSTHGTSAVEKFADHIRTELDAAYPGNRIEAVLPPFPVQEGVLYRSTNALRSNVVIASVESAWTELVKNHEMMRTVFHFGSELVQVVLDADACGPCISHQEINLSDDQSFQGYFIKHFASTVARDVNEKITEVPPVRLLFFNGPPSARYLVLSIHHALYDGISLPVLLQDIERAYNHQPQLQSAPLRDILEQFMTIDYDAARSFWTTHLKDYPWHRLLNKAASSSSPNIASVHFKHPLSALQSKAASKQVTLQALFMCAYGSLVAEHIYSHDDVVFGAIRSGRSLPVDHLDTTICPVIIVVPARNTQQEIARAGEYEHIPLSRIQKWIPECTGSLFDTLFSVSFKENGTSALWNIIESQNPEPDYILAVEVVLDPAQDQVVVHAAFTSDDISAAVVQQILSQLEDVATRIANDTKWAPSFALSKQNGTSVVPPPSRQFDEEPILFSVDREVVSNICTIAAQFLRVNDNLIKSETSLLSLGLDSIKSVGLSRKLSAAGLRLTSADIMKFPTPLRLAAHMQASSTSQNSVDEAIDNSAFAADSAKLKDLLGSNVKLSEDDEVKVYPTSMLQSGMLSQTVHSQGHLYVHLFPLRLAADTHVERVKAAWERAISLFDILRTTFHFIAAEGVWAQVVHSTSTVQWSEHSFILEDQLVDVLNPLLKIADEDRMFERPPVYLNLVSGPTPNEPQHLVVVMHHALYDGHSISDLFYVVQQIYAGTKPPRRPEYHQLLPRIKWQERNGTSFWAERLRGLQHVPIPKKNSPDQPATTFHTSLPVSLDLEQIRRACGNAQVTPQCLGQAAFAKILATLTKCRDVVFGRVVSGRDMPGADEVVGPMLNTIPCRIVISTDASNKELLQQVHDHNITCLRWQHASLRSIQREVGVSDLWDSLFVFQPKGEAQQSEQAAPWMFDVGDGVDLSIQYPLNIELHETETGFTVEAACMSSIANQDELRGIVLKYANFLGDMFQQLDGPASAGLPEIPTAPSAPTGKAIVDEPSQPDLQDDDEWLVAIRGVLAVAARVSEAKIVQGTHLATLGIDSITAIQISANARRIGLRLSAVQVAQSKTVSDLVQKIKEKVPSNASNGKIANGEIRNVTNDGSPKVPLTLDVPRTRWTSIVPAHLVDDVERITATSAGMEWMIGMWQRSKGSRFQHVFGYLLPADVNPSRLQSAWDQLLLKHAILRSTFAYDTDHLVPRTVIFKPSAVASLWSQETPDSAEDAFSVVQQRMKDLVSHPPSFERPWTRGLFLSFSQSNYLVIRFHHFQYDAWSLQLLVDDLSRLYVGDAPRSSNNLDGFLLYVNPSSPTVREEKAHYWEATFRDQTVTLFPSLSNACLSSRGVHIDQSAVSDAAKLEGMARNMSISLQSVFLACWSQVQAKHTQSDAITFSLWHSGRTGDLEEAERLAVACVNTLPFLVPGAQSSDTLSLAKRIHEDLQARPAMVQQSRLVEVHESIGRGNEPLSNVFVNIVKIAPDVEKSSSELFQGLEVPYYIPQVPDDAAVGMSELRVTQIIRDDIMVEFVVLEESDQVVMSIEYAGHMLDEDGAKLLVREWGALVKDALHAGQT